MGSVHAWTKINLLDYNGLCFKTNHRGIQEPTGIRAPVASLYSAIRLPSESNTEWIVTAVGEVSVRTTRRQAKSYI